MKKSIALVVAACFVVGVASVSFAAPAKKAVAKKVVKKVLPKKVAPAPIIKSVTPPPPPPPKPIAPKPAPVVVAPAPAVGMGLEVGGKVGLIAGGTGAAGEVKYGIGSMLGLGDAVKVVAGAVYASGTPSGAANAIKFGALYVGGQYVVYKDSAMSAYVGATVNMPVKVSGSASGSVGGSVLVGGEYLVMPGSAIFGEAGYEALRASNTPSLKGVTAVVGYKMAF